MLWSRGLTANPTNIDDLNFCVAKIFRSINKKVQRRTWVARTSVCCSDNACVAKTGTCNAAITNPVANLQKEIKFGNCVLRKN